MNKYTVSGLTARNFVRNKSQIAARTAFLGKKWWVLAEKTWVSENRQWVLENSQ
jgi:hypothetical protein